MTFTKAMQLLKDGKKVTRKVWGNDYHIFLRNERFYDNKNIKEVKLTAYDITATDWMEVQNINAEKALKAYSTLLGYLYLKKSMGEYYLVDGKNVIAQVDNNTATILIEGGIDHD